MTLLRAHGDDARHPIRLEELAQFLLDDRALASRGVPQKKRAVIACDNPDMKHVEMLTGRSKENQVATLQMRLEPPHRWLGYT